LLYIKVTTLFYYSKTNILETIVFMLVL